MDDEKKPEAPSPQAPKRHYAHVLLECDTETGELRVVTQTGAAELSVRAEKVE